MVEVKLHDADTLDYSAFAQLQKESFAQLLAKSKTSDSFLVPEYFEWKYRPASKLAKIAVVYEGTEMVAANAMMPFVVRLGDQEIVGWQSCDTATLPNARGKGFFIECLRKLQEAIGPNEVFYGFPNKNSVRGFMKIGWTAKSIVTTWLNPIALIGGKRSVYIDKRDRFDERQDEFAQNLVGVDRGMVLRSSDYLNWRYVAHPIHAYTVFSFERDRLYCGYAVARLAEVMGRRVCLLMEQFGQTATVEKALLRHVCKWAAAQGVWQVVLMDTMMPLGAALGAGFMPVPHRLLPKTHVLMGQSFGGPAASNIQEAPWRVQMGDWDAF